MATTKATTSTGIKAKSPAETPGKKLVPAAPERANVAKKRQTVREKFAIPAFEYEQLLDLKARLNDRGTPVKKSELVRAGLMLLTALDDDELSAVLARVTAGGL